ncbi:hypothetical protein LEP1GSC071_2031 [Leptospira santarosai str. JET]|nr:hypothetical protein LEP1GSC071_2031 [Leptospira santarosai str. JET]
MKFLHVFFLNYPKTQTVLSYIVKFSQSLPNSTFCFSDVDRNKICPKNMKDTSIKSKNNDFKIKSPREIVVLRPITKSKNYFIKAF